jgi:putative membrane protein
MRHLFRLSAAACAVALGVAVATADDTGSPSTQKGDKGKFKTVTDAEFVKMAASGGLFEVKSSELAKDQGQSAEVKRFADRMIKDHTKANKELETVAKKAGLEVPTKMTDEHAKLLDQVKAAKGSDFDRTYMTTQVKAHEEAVALFEAASKSVKNPDLKAFAAKTLPVIKEHYEHAKHHGGKGGTDKRGDRNP